MDIILMGLPKSGKTSIQRVVFSKMSPHETFFLVNTQQVETTNVNNNPNIQFQIKDFPGTKELRENNQNDIEALKACGSLIYVIDAHEQDKEMGCDKLFEIIKVAHKVNPQITFEVFIHKVDSDMFMQDEQKFDALNEISQNMRRLLSEYGVGDGQNQEVQIGYHLTSIYDHTIYQALSRVIQKLLPQVQYIQQLLDQLVRTSQIQKAFLFDVISKIYIATDENPVEMKDYEICSELIDVLIDVTCIYGTDETGGNLTFDDKSSSTIKLHSSVNDNNVMLYLKEVDKCLALVCLINENKIQKQHLINYNIDQFKLGLKQIFNASTKAKQT